MFLAASFAATAIAGIVAIALGVLDALPTWFGPAIGCLLSLSWLCVVAAFYVSDEPMRTKGGEVITKKSSPFWYRINFVALFGIGAASLLVCMVLMLTACGQGPNPSIERTGSLLEFR